MGETDGRKGQFKLGKWIKYRVRKALSSGTRTMEKSRNKQREKQERKRKHDEVQSRYERP
jgi:hypothetical protein